LQAKNFNLIQTLLAFVVFFGVVVVLLEVVVAGAAVTAGLLDFLFIDEDKRLHLLWLKSGLAEELVVGHALAHFVDAVNILDLGAVFRIDVDHAVH